MTRVYLGLGSNLGDRRLFLKRAVHALNNHDQLSVTALSPVYETPPWGLEEQPAYLNMVVAATSRLEPRELLAAVKALELSLGREQSLRWGPRQIDIDILYFGDEIVEIDNDQGQPLQIPHARIAERLFVLMPLAGLAPQFVDPRSRRTVTQMLQDMPPDERIRRLPLPLEWGWQTHVMGIVNVTPDSFSGDGLLQHEPDDDWLTSVVDQARSFVSDGADIIDLGGESTRPGSQPLEEEDEMRRVLPALRAIRQVVDLPISVDTYRASVARAALEAGADWINDVWGLRMDEALAELVSHARCPVVLMHNRSQPKNVAQEQRLGGRYVGIHYVDLIGDIKRELLESVELALNAGILEENIILDPGIGFGKTISQNLQLIDQLHHFKELGYPLLLGTSRKSFIGYTLDLPPQQRMEGTAATVAIGIDRGADIVRVHDVKAISRVARMTDGIVRRAPVPGQDS